MQHLSKAIASLPAYLQAYCVDQAKVIYTARDQAAWRFILRQSRSFFKDHGVPVYLEGLKKTGITLDRIPLIEDMNRKLNDLGWGAVPVCGFIPPAAFLDFQARRILPIATDMRSVEHIHYTPAPDIVHEAAGHAPIIADPSYSDYLTQYAAMAQKAIFSQEDLELYEAIRSLSDIKENPDSSPEMIKVAEAALASAVAATTFISEANKVARMNWWTVEYGLLGSLENPKIYGAGLLSSVGESRNCLSPQVKKIRLSTACVDTPYDITEPQPQLFVGEDINHLSAILSEFETTLAYKRGGLYGLQQAQKCHTVTTTVLGSGVQIGGILTEFIRNKDERIDFLRFSGPVQLAFEEKELPDQGVAHHRQGFSSPIGRFVACPDKAPQHLSSNDLATIGLVQGKRCTLELISGFRVAGIVAQLIFLKNMLAIIKWQDCKVTRQEEVYFEPSWGDFDMVIGDQVTSVFGGPPDREAFGSHDVGQATTSPGRKTPFTAEEKIIFDAYQELRDLRSDIQKSSANEPQQVRARQLRSKIQKEFPNEWLLQLETLELGYQMGWPKAVTTEQQSQMLANAANYGKDIALLIKQGVQLASVAV